MSKAKSEVPYGTLDLMGLKTLAPMGPCKDSASPGGSSKWRKVP